MKPCQDCNSPICNQTEETENQTNECIQLAAGVQGNEADLAMVQAEGIGVEMLHLQLQDQAQVARAISLTTEGIAATKVQAAARGYLTRKALGRGRTNAKACRESTPKITSVSALAIGDEGQ
jgi:hypothetical protein